MDVCCTSLGSPHHNASARHTSTQASVAIKDTAVVESIQMTGKHGVKTPVVLTARRWGTASLSAAQNVPIDVPHI
jgi:hypothetical protein